MQDPRQHDFLEKVRSHKGIILKVIHLYADGQHDRDDLYQEILFQAWKAFAGFKGRSKFSTWLYKVSLNTALTYRRKEFRRGDQREVFETDVVEHSEPKEQAKQQLLWAIKQLGEVDRMIILLHLEGYGNDEVAQMTGLTKNNVGVKLHRIKERLTKIIRKEEEWT